MRYSKLFLGCVVATAVIVAAGARAQEPTNQLTYFTFSAPVELPGGQTLPAGKYTFRIMDSPSNRHIVQILGEDGRQMIATLLAIPAQRQDPPSEPEVRFMEGPASAPPAIRTWWYPGRTIGHEFIYPRSQARRLAAGQREGVLTIAGDQTKPEEMQSADLTRLSSDGRDTPVTTNEAAAAESTRASAPTAAPAPAPAPTAEPPAAAPREPMTARQEPAPRVSEPATARQEPAPRVSEPVATPPQAPAPDRRGPLTVAPEANTSRSELPQTASVLPLVGLIGVVSLMGAGLLRGWRRR